MNIRRHLRRIGYLTGGVVLLGSLWSAPASAATYYLSPTGADANAGTSASAPWKTFKFALPKLRPGDTLVLHNGTYTGANSGYPNINCSAGARNGTATQPITLKAETERKALIAGTGTGNSFSMRDCAYWTIQGLQVRSADAKVESVPAVVHIEDSSHLTLRRLLVHHSNRYLLNPLLLLQRTSYSLVEESEFYYFHRYAISTKYGTNNTFRRNYINSRGYADIPGGVSSAWPGLGDVALGIYPGSNHVLENNISEGNGSGVYLEAYGTTAHNRILGNISVNDNIGATLRARGASADMMPQNTMIRDFVAITPTSVGVYARSAKNTKCVNCSVFNGQQGLTADRMASYPGDGASSFYADNSLVVKNTGVGINIADQASWLIDYPNTYGNKLNSSPQAGVPQITNERTVDPRLGSCKVFIPASSSMKKAGKGGADIGANILYRYQNGALTTQPLWEPATGKFPCGAVVAGVNDVAGASCSSVHQRLNVQANGCALPSGYGASSLTVSSPANLRIVQMQ
jgi:hypothetical protein